MDIRTVPYTLKQLKSMYKKGSINLTYPLQRGDVWDRKRKSEFIRSLFIGLKILPILSIQESLEEPRIVNGKQVKMSSIIDGKQRLLSVFQYLNDEFSTPSNTIYKDINEEEFNVSHKKFSQLSENEQMTFLNFTLNVTGFSDYTINDIERLILAYNSGKSMTNKQILKIEIGLNNTIKLKNFIKNDSFFKAAKKRFSKTQNNNNEDLLGLIRAMILFSDINMDSKSFEFEDMIIFIKEYEYNSLLEKVGKATKILEEILLQEKSENYIYISKIDWTFYLKYLPYLIYVAYKMPITLIKKLLNDASLKYIMPNKLLIKKSEINNKDFIQNIIDKIEINNTK